MDVSQAFGLSLLASVPFVIKMAVERDWIERFVGWAVNCLTRREG